MNYRKSILTLSLCIVSTATLLGLGTEIQYSASDSTSKEYKYIKSIFNTINNNVYLLADIAQNLDLNPEQNNTRTVEKLRIRHNNCTLLENPENQLVSPEPIDLNVEYKILKYENRHYQIRYSDDIKLWVHEECADKFASEEQVSDIEMLFKVNINNQIEVAKIALETIEENYQKAQVFKKQKVDKLPDESSLKALLKVQLEKIENKRKDAKAIYDYYIFDKQQTVIPKLAFHKRLSLVTEMAFGSSKFRTHYSEFLRDESKAGNTDISVRGSYQIKANSRVNFNLGHRAESLQTSYKNTQLGATYLSEYKNLKYAVTGSFNSYKDEFRGINSYDRINLSGRASQNLGDNIKMAYNLGITNYNYKVDNQYDFTRMFADVRSALGKTSSKNIELRLRADASKSDLSSNNYLHLMPEVNFKSRTARGSSTITVFGERFDFDDIPQRSSDKLFLGYEKQAQGLDGKNKTMRVHAYARVFPEADQNNFYQFLIGSSNNQYGDTYKTKRSQLSLRYFPNNLNFSHADYNFEYGNYKRFYSVVNGNIRYWYPDETSFVSTDIYLKVGYQGDNLRIGPLLGIHNNTDLKASEISAKSDKNVYRVGAEAQGNYIIESIYRVNFRVAYDYGFNYNATVTTVSDLGEIMYGELVERHPTTIQVDADVAAPVHEKIDLFARVNYYKLDTDISSNLSVNPIIQRDRVSILIGFRLRYN